MPRMAVARDHVQLLLAAQRLIQHAAGLRRVHPILLAPQHHRRHVNQTHPLQRIHEKGLGTPGKRKLFQGVHAAGIRIQSAIDVRIRRHLQAGSHPPQRDAQIITPKQPLHVADRAQRSQRRARRHRQRVPHRRVQNDKRPDARIQNGRLQHGRPSRRQPERRNTPGIHVGHGLEQIDRGADVVHPVINPYKIPLAVGFAVAAHVHRQTGHPSLGQVLAQFEVMLFELARAVTNDQHRRGPRRLRGEERGLQHGTGAAYADRLPRGCYHDHRLSL